MTKIDAADVAAVLGIGMIAGGLAAWDWRVALVVVGALLLAAAVAGVWRSQHGPG